MFLVTGSWPVISPWPTILSQVIDKIDISQQVILKAGEAKQEKIVEMERGDAEVGEPLGEVPCL